MGKLRSPLRLRLSCSRLLPPPLYFVLRWGGGFSGLEGFPHLLYQAAHKGRARLLGGCPPLSFGLESFPPLSSSSLHAVRWGRTLIGGRLGASVGFWVPHRLCIPCAGSARYSGGSPSSSSYLVGVPSSRSGMPCAGSACCCTGGSSSSSGISPRAVGARGPFPAPSSTWLRGFPSSCSGMPCDGSACCHTGGYPPSSWLGSHAVGARSPSPSPCCPRAVCARSWGGGGPSSSWALSPGGVPRWCAQGFPSVPPLRAAGARCWVGGPPHPSPPPRPLALGAGGRSGGDPRLDPSAVGLPRSKSLLGSPLWIMVPPSQGGSLAGAPGGPLPLPRFAP